MKTRNLSEVSELSISQLDPVGTIPKANGDLMLLMGRMARGDGGAMSQFYDATCPLVFGFARRILGNTHDAEEVLVDVYAKVWTLASRFDSQYGGVKRWLILITRSRSIDTLRRRNLWHRYHSSLEMQTNASRESVQLHGALAPTQEGERLHSQRGRKLDAALQSLSQEQRQAIHLAFFSDLTHTDIAENLNIPLGTVKTRIRSGLQHLRRILRSQRPQHFS